MWGYFCRLQPCHPLVILPQPGLGRGHHDPLQRELADMLVFIGFMAQHISETLTFMPIL